MSCQEHPKICVGVPHPAIARYSATLRGARARIVVPAPGFDFTESSPCTNCILSRMLINPRPCARESSLFFKARSRIRHCELNRLRCAM